MHFQKKIWTGSSTK